MKKLTLITVVFLACFGMLAANAVAIPISAEISFSGGYKLINGTDLANAEGLTFTGTAEDPILLFVTGVTGDFSDSISVGDPIQLSDIYYNPIQEPIIPLWAAGDFKFNLDNFWVVEPIEADSLKLRGYGTAIDITGAHEDTAGEWILTANTSGSTFSFSASTSVPDASLMLLLGPALVGLGLLGRRRRA